jgi:cytochrome c2
MKRLSVLIWCAAGFFAAAPAISGDATAGRALFRQRCSLCHTAESGDGGGAEGPSLVGVFGRAAASSPQFSYTDALRSAHLTWDAATLNRFLSAPTTVVPGSTMVLAVPEETGRVNLIAYFQSLSNLQSTPTASEPIVVPKLSEESANWRLDAPGRVHRISVASLPPAFATDSSRNRPSVVPKPANATLALPPGFHVDTFATGLRGPRKMLVAPNGDVLVTETSGGRVSVLHPAPDGARAAGSEVYTEGLKQPFGLAFYPNAQNPQWL